MCVLSNRDPLTFPVWNILKHIILQEKRFIFQEIIEILQISQRCLFFERKDKNDQNQSSSVSFQQALRKEIQFKCFKESMNNMAMELDDL